MERGMLETFFLLYGIVIVAGSFLMLQGVSEAPLGYEDEEGFHYMPAAAANADRHSAEPVRR